MAALEAVTMHITQTSVTFCAGTSEPLSAVDAWRAIADYCTERLVNLEGAS
jgi:hypothetical protein